MNEQPTPLAPGKVSTFALKLWARLNDRRCHLIERNHAGVASDAERIELAQLQMLADECIQVFAPLPIAELEAYMKSQGIDVPNEFRPRLGGGFELAGAPDELAQASDIRTLHKISISTEAQLSKCEDPGLFVPSGDSVSDTCIVKLVHANTEANDRIRELETQLASANARAERWRLAAEEESWPFEWQVATEYKERAEKAEAQLAEARNAINIHVAQSERINGELAAEVVRLEAQLAEAQRESEAMKLEQDRLRTALEAVETWMASNDGPLETMWDNGDIGSYEDDDMSWELTLDQVRKLDIDPLMLGVLGDSEAVKVYRAVLAALNPRGEGEE